MADPAVTLDWSKAEPVKGDAEPAPAGGPPPTLDWGKAEPVKPGSDMEALDTESGLPFMDAVHLSSADSFEEKKAYLTSVYGNANVSSVREPSGAEHLTVKRGDQWVLAEGGGGMMRRAAVDVTAHGLEYIGMGYGAAGGGALGAPGGPAGMLAGAVAGGAMGGAAGKTVEKGLQYATAPATLRPGLKNQNDAVLDSAEGGALGEMGGKIVGKGIDKLARGGLPKALTGATDEIKAQFRRVTAKGGRPPIQSVAPDLRKLARMELLADKISGSPTSRNAANRAMLEKQTKEIMKNGGVPAHSVDAAYDDMKNGHFADTGEAVGESVRKRIEAHTKMLETRVDTAITTAKAEVDKQLKTLDELANKYEKGTLGVDVAKGVLAAKQSFSSTMERVYGHADKLFGGAPQIETKGIRGTANMLLKRAQGVQPTPGARQVAGVKAPQAAEQAARQAGGLFDDFLKDLGIEMPKGPNDKITWTQAQRMRTVLQDAARDPAIISSQKKGEIRMMAMAVDRAIQKAGAQAGSADAVRLLNKADAMYSEGRAKFADAELRSFLDTFKKTRTVPDPAQVAELLIQTGQTQRALEFQKTLGPEIWGKVAAQDMTNLLTGAVDPLSGKIDPSRLASEVAGRRGMVSAIHGADVEKRMLAFARNLAATDGKLPAEALEPGAFRTLMEQYEAASKEMDEFVKGNPIAALGDPKIPPAEVYARVTKPGDGSMLRKVVDFLAPVGKDGRRPPSKELNDLRATALRQALAESTATVSTETEMTGMLDKYLSRYTREQQELLFPDGMADALRLLSKDMQFVFPKIQDPGMAGMTAGAIQQRFFVRRWWAQGMAAAGRWLIDHPGFQTYLIGERTPGKFAQGAQGASMQLARFFANEAMSEGTDMPEGATPDPAPEAAQ